MPATPSCNSKLRARSSIRVQPRAITRHFIGTTIDLHGSCLSGASPESMRRRDGKPHGTPSPALDHREAAAGSDYWLTSSPGRTSVGISDGSPRSTTQRPRSPSAADRSRPRNGWFSSAARQRGLPSQLPLFRGPALSSITMPTTRPFKPRSTLTMKRPWRGRSARTFYNSFGSTSFVGRVPYRW